MATRLALFGSFSVLMTSQVYHFYRKTRESAQETLYTDSPDKATMLKSIHSQAAASYDLQTEGFEWSKRIDKYRKVLVSYAEGKVLEIGIGTGRNWPYYNAGCKVIGVDWSPEMLEVCDKKKHKAPLQEMLMEMDATCLTFPDHTFDTVVLTFVLSSTHAPRSILKEALRVCKPKGRVLVLDWGEASGVLTNIFLNLYRYENLMKYGYDQLTDIESVVTQAGAHIETAERKQGGHVYFYMLRPS